jgi:hypothetical protein
MRQRRRRLNWVRVTRDPAVAAAHERSVEASAEWTRALVEALRTHLGTPYPIPQPPPPSDKPVQYALPFGAGDAEP